MRKILLGGVALMALAAAHPSFAADLPHYSPPAAPSYYSPAPVFNWSGLYVGVNGGYGFGGFSGGGFSTADAGVLGGTVGYNYQIDQFVVGVESDLDWTGFESSKSYLPGPVSQSAKLDDLWTVRGRVGYAMDNILLYATGGYAGGVIETHLTDASTSPATVFGGNNYSSGYSLGGGIEYAFSNAVSLKAEYLYTQLDRQWVFGGPHLTTVGVQESLVRGGLNFHF